MKRLVCMVLSACLLLGCMQQVGMAEGTMDGQNAPEQEASAAGETVASDAAIAPTDEADAEADTSPSTKEHEAPVESPATTPETASAAAETPAPTEAPTTAPEAALETASAAAETPAPTEAPVTPPEETPETASTAAEMPTPTEAPTTAPEAALETASAAAETPAPTEASVTPPETAPETAPAAAETPAPTEEPMTLPEETPKMAPAAAETPVPIEAPTTAPEAALDTAPAAAETPVPTEAPTTAPEAALDTTPAAAETPVPTEAPMTAPETALDVASAAAETPYCELCGGVPAFSAFVADDWGHRSACPHGVVNPASRYEEHYAYCDAPDVCMICGHACTDTVILHSPEYTEWLSDDTGHWGHCTYCGFVGNNKSEHVAACNNRNVCHVCGHSCSGDNIWHDDHFNYIVDSWQSDDTSHWHLCTACGEVLDKMEHFAACDNPTVCGWCGHAYSGDDIVHSYDWDSWQSDDTSHWRVCKRCGEAEDNKSGHYATCDNPTVCATCGHDYSGDNISHYDTDNWKSDDTSHWRVCKRCGEAEDNKSGHSATCDNPTVCATCGHDYSGDNILHSYDWDSWQSDDTSHWHVCKRCGDVYIYSKSKHYAMCDNPHAHVCAACGHDYSGDNISHSYDWDNQQSDDISHWYVCTVCGEVGYKNEHWAECDNPHVCVDCGHAYSGDDISHSYDWDSWQSDDTGHWPVCTVCGEVGEKGEHWAECDNPTVCARCGQPYAGASIRHDSTEMQSDDTAHWRVCARCGEIESVRNGHWAWCDAPNVCAECGHAYTGADIRHHTLYNEWQSDDFAHWVVCLCGEVQTRLLHRADCDRPNICAECGHAYTGDNIRHVWTETQSDDTSHWIPCSCGEKKFAQENHWAYCSTPNECAVCHHVYTGTDIRHGAEMQSDDTAHWFVCGHCGEGESGRETHWAYCDAPNVCARCGRTYTGTDIRHDEYGEIQADDTMHWYICSRCGEKMGQSPHYAVCYRAHQCVECGHTYAGTDIRHSEDEILEAWQFDNTVHWKVCYYCGEELNKGEHWANCDAPNVCETCGQPYTGKNVAHIVSDDDPWAQDATCHWKVCERCGEPVGKKEHVWELTAEVVPGCETEGSKTYTCANCGSQYEEAQAKLGHAEWNFDSKTDPTCTTDGEERFVCSRCGLPHSRPINATGHSFGAYAPQNDGTHAASCRNCGTLKSEPCTYNEAGVCTVCGAAKPAAEATAAPVVVPAEEAATVVEIVKEVQEVVAQAQETVAQAQEAVAQALSAPENAAAQQALLDAIVVTTETLENETVLTVADQTALLPEDSGILRLFTAELNQQEQTVTPEGLVQIRLAWEDELDIVLYRLTEDGELVEVVFEYDAENKVLVFDTDVMGTFVIVPKA